MNRREFIAAAGAGLVSLATPNLVFSKSAPKPAKVVRQATDRFDLICPDPSRVRILQLTDTHYGRPTADNKLKDELSRKLIRKLVDEQQPSLVFHTGDFINNDVAGVEHSAIDFMNDLGAPWSLVFGNHDHGNVQNSLSLNDYYKRLENHATGYKTDSNGAREYCFRIDIRDEKGKVGATLLGFNCGSPMTKMIVTEGQVAWLKTQLENDAKAGHKHPILVMQHIPTIEFKTLYDDKATVGRQGEKVCFESDLGAVFEVYRASDRVRAVFCGHDHVNDYVGVHKGVKLAYGRVSGWSGYGDWQRGGRAIDINLNDQSYRTRVVLSSGASEKPEWSLTLKDS